jgi:hypothetical protein
MLGNALTNCGAIAVHQVEHTLGNAGAIQDLGDWRYSMTPSGCSPAASRYRRNFIWRAPVTRTCS